MIGKVLKVVFLSLLLIGFANAGGKGGGTGDNERIEVGDYVWLDSNQNGIQDSSENGIGNVYIELYCDNTLVDYTYTDSNGNYSFNNEEVIEGNDNNCKIVIKPNAENNGNILNNLVLAQQNAGSNDDIDSDAYVDNSGNYVIDIPTTITKDDSPVNSLDFGFAPKPSPVRVGDYVWVDKNRDGIQNNNEKGIANINVKLVCNGVVEDQTITDSNGHYSFYSDKITKGNSNNCKIVIENQSGICNFEPTIKDAGDDDSIDSDAYVDSNGDIVVDIPNSIDPNNSPVDNLDFGFKPCSVCIGDYVWNDSNKDGIQDASEEPLSGVWVSLYDKNGDKVANMQTGNDGKYEFCELYPGEKYYVEFIKPGFTYSPKDRGGDDTLDSDVNSNGKTDLITIGDSNNNTIDAGMYKTPEKRYCLGNVYWLDENLNGIKDSNEKGVAGIVVKLYDENRKYIAQTTTNSNGEYKFCNLKKGKYYLHFDLPDGYMFINKNQSKVDSNGWSPLIDLNGDRLDLNAGIYCGCYDYKANPQNHKKLKLGVSPYAFVVAILLLIRVTFKKD